MALLKNFCLVVIPAGCPELNAAEDIWQDLRETYLANRLFQTYDVVVDATANACNKLPARLAAALP
jgi:transposase